MTYKKQTIRFIVAFICFIAFVTTTDAQEGLPDLFARIKPSVVSIIAYDKEKKRIARGSGFCVATNQIVTNKHVIEDAFSIEIHTSDNRTYKVLKTISVDETGDLALLETESLDSKVKPLVLANYSPREGDKIIVVGNPLGLEGSVSDGIVSAFRTTRDLGKLIQITAPISPGSSGSPVINLEGEVVGVATLNLEGGQNLNFAISSERIISLWKNSVTISNNKPNTLPSSVTGNKQSTPEGLYEQGTNSYNKGNFSEALSYFEETIQRKSNYTMAYLWAGVSSYQLKQYEKSIDFLNRAIQLEPGLYLAHHFLGLDYYVSKLYGNAITAFEKAIKLAPDKSKDKAATIFSLGLAYKVFGDSKAASEQQKLLETMDTDKAKQLLSILNPNISGYWANPTTGYWNHDSNSRYKIVDDGIKIIVQSFRNGEYYDWFEGIWDGDVAISFLQNRQVCYAIKRLDSNQVLFTPMYTNSMKIKSKDSPEQIRQKIKSWMNVEYLYVLERIQ